MSNTSQTGPEKQYLIGLHNNVGSLDPSRLWLSDDPIRPDYKHEQSADKKIGTKVETIGAKPKH
jgi:hypothetical protein